MPTTTIYRLKVTLKDSHPPIWRRIETADCSLLDLHDVIQLAMGWEFSHLWHFQVGDEYFGEQSEFEMDWEDAKAIRLSDLMNHKVKKFTYLYDFGDSWEHSIQFEKSGEADPSMEYPRCTDGKLACPPEDCGGIWGYGDLVEAIRDPKHEQHEELLDWIGEFDPEEFDLQDVNARLEPLHRRKKKSRSRAKRT
jgi:hypothetical protein